MARVGPATRAESYGRCPTCGWLGAVRKDGLIRAHRQPLPDGRQSRAAPHCPGGKARPTGGDQQ